MLLFVESDDFPFRTFVVRVRQSDTIARVRAQLLHVLFEIGRAEHQFRLRFNGVYLRDADTVRDYDVMENAVLKMITLTKNNDIESMIDVQSLGSGGTAHSEKAGMLGPGVKDALVKEVNHFQRRERLIQDFKSLLYIHFLACFFGFFTVYWFSGFWNGFIWAMAVLFCPSYTHTRGYVGLYSVYRNWFCIVYTILAVISLAVSIFFSAIEWIHIIDHGCSGWQFIGDCSHTHVFSAIFFTFQALILLISSVIACILLWNMKVEVGDFIEKYLVQTRDIELVMKAARNGRVKERRVAAFELATLAASGEDNKFRIVAEGGLEVLIRMALSADSTTQEHAVEAIAELLTIPVIQDSLVDMGGARTLTALLHSQEQRLVHEAAVALSYIVSDSEDNKGAVVNEHGLDDLCHAAGSATMETKRIIAGIILELAFNSNIRTQMASLNSPAEAMIKLCRSPDPDTQRYALQTLELLAIESSHTICAQQDLLEVLLKIPKKTTDDRICLLAGKILLYFAESRETCEQMLDYRHVRESLTLYARSSDPMLQKVIVKVIFCALEVKELKYRAQHLELDRVLKAVRDHAEDRESWDMADQALQFMYADDDDLMTLPQLSTVEKLDRMSQQVAGSRTSLTSNASR